MTLEQRYRATLQDVREILEKMPSGYYEKEEVNQVFESGTCDDAVAFTAGQAILAIDTALSATAEPVPAKQWEPTSIVGGDEGSGLIQFNDLLPEVQAALNQVAERDMTPEEALAEAIRRWPRGDTAVQIEVIGYTHGQVVYRVGSDTEIVLGKNGYKGLKGEGKSFRAAFEAADKK